GCRRVRTAVVHALRGPSRPCAPCGPAGGRDDRYRSVPGSEAGARSGMAGGGHDDVTAQPRHCPSCLTAHRIRVDVPTVWSVTTARWSVTTVPGPAPGRAACVEGACRAVVPRRPRGGAGTDGEACRIGSGTARCQDDTRACPYGCGCAPGPDEVRFQVTGTAGSQFRRRPAA